MHKKNITIIGGYGLMGQLFNSLLSKAGYNVRNIGEKDWELAPPILANSDWVIISVPIHLTGFIINKAADLIKSDCILSDFTSIKTEPLLTMLSKYNGPVVGLHPMFGPTINDTKQQVIVVCNGRFPEKYQWVIELLLFLGFTLKTMPASEHDQAMNFIQGVEHFLTFSLGTFLHQKNQHPQELMQMASPIYMAKLLLMGRIFDQDPALYADIIMADKNRLALIKEFSIWLNQWITKLEENNKQEFIKEFKQASEWMGTFTRYSQELSDKFLNNQLTDSIQSIKK